MNNLILNSKKIKYKNGQESNFFKQLEKRIDDYFKLNGIHKKANGAMIVKTTICLVCYFSLLGWIALGALNPFWVIITYMVLGFWGALIFFNISHDASHHAYSKTPFINKILSYTFELLGVSSYMWNYLHNVVHHQFTSIESIDLLIDESGMVRLSGEQKYRNRHKYQHLYAPFLYGMYSLFWVTWVDIMLFKLKRMGNMDNIKHPLKEWVKMIVLKTLYFTYVFIIPYIVSQQPFWVILVGFLFMQGVTGLIIGTISVLNHQIYESIFPKPDIDGVIDDSRKDHELKVTIDFAPTSSIASWLFGGFNTHTAHHLFPDICHIHYRNITPIIKETALEFGMPYNEKTFAGAIVSHFKFLKAMGTPPSTYEEVHV